MANYKKSKAMAVRNHKYGAIGRHWDKQKTNYLAVFSAVVFLILYGIVGNMEYNDELAEEAYRAHINEHGIYTPYTPKN